MRGAIVLGLRLTGAGAGPARLRTALVVLATCVGTVLLLVVGAIANAEQTVDHTMYASSWELRLLLYAVTLTVSMPILALVATAGRLSAELRDRRLGNLRLLGLSPVQTRAVAVSEAAASAVVGVVLGAALFQAVRPILTLIHVAGRHWSYPTLTPTIVWYAVICAVVLFGVVAIGVLPQRTRMASALARARKADARRPSWWRVVPLLAGTGICAQQLVRSGQDPHDVEWVLFVGTPLLGLGLVLVVPVLVRLLADALLRSAASPIATVAARRMQAQPAAVSRVVSALLIGLFVVTGARAVVGVRGGNQPGRTSADRPAASRSPSNPPDGADDGGPRHPRTRGSAGAGAPDAVHILPQTRVVWHRRGRKLCAAAGDRAGVDRLCRRRTDVAGGRTPGQPEHPGPRLARTVRQGTVQVAVGSGVDSRAHPSGGRRHLGSARTG